MDNLTDNMFTLSDISWYWFVPLFAMATMLLVVTVVIFLCCRTPSSRPRIPKYSDPQVILRDVNSVEVITNPSAANGDKTSQEIHIYDDKAESIYQEIPKIEKENKMATETEISKEGRELKRSRFTTVKNKSKRKQEVPRGSKNSRVKCLALPKARSIKDTKNVEFNEIRPTWT